MLYALDARTGEEIWKNNIVDYKPGIGGSTGGIIIINGKVLVGMTNCGRPKTDDHCYISAYDAKTGKRDWKFVTVALKGDPGGDSWGDLPDNQRKGAETWIAGTYEPHLLGRGPGQAVASRPARLQERRYRLCQLDPGAGSRHRQDEMVLPARPG